MKLPHFNNLTRFVIRPMTVQRDELGRIMMWTVTKSTFVSIPYEQGNRICFVEKDIADQGYDMLAQHMLENWELHLSVYHNTMDAMADAARHAMTATTKQEMADAYTRWTNSLIPFSHYCLAPFAVEKILDPMCRELLSKHYPKNIDKYFSIISSPETMHEYQKMREKIFESAIIQDISDSTCSRLARDFGWYSEYSYIEPLLDSEYFRKEIKNISSDTAKEELNKMHQDLSRSKREFTEFITEVTDPKLKKLAIILHTYTLLRTERIDKFKQAQAVMRLFFDHLAEIIQKETQNSWTKHEVVSLTNKEILAYLTSDTTPSFEYAKQRLSQQYVYYTINGEPNFIMDPNEIDAFIQSVTDQHEITSIKGTIAFKGIATGKVVILKGKHDLEKVQQGDILVAPTTMPDYLPAMNKAIAFVTDEGGITSHAAIVARELKKPCIVGTKLATQIFKDGDMVEVDAVTGIIRKI